MPDLQFLLQPKIGIPVVLILVIGFATLIAVIKKIFSGLRNLTRGKPFHRIDNSRPAGNEIFPKPGAMNWVDENGIGPILLFTRQNTQNTPEAEVLIDSKASRSVRIVWRHANVLILIWFLFIPVVGMGLTFFLTAKAPYLKILIPAAIIALLWVWSYRRRKLIRTGIFVPATLRCFEVVSYAKRQHSGNLRGIGENTKTVTTQFYVTFKDLNGNEWFRPIENFDSVSARIWFRKNFGPVTVAYDPQKPWNFIVLEFSYLQPR